MPSGKTLVDRLPSISIVDDAISYNVFNGLFRRTNPPRYDSTTNLPVDVEAMQRFISSLDFHKRFVTLLDDYWQKTKSSHPQSLRISFIAACNKQVQEGSLSDVGRQLAWQAAGLMAKTPGLQIRPLNVYGYAATDLIYIADQAQQQVLLYLPGNSSPFQEFDGMDAMKDWLGEQCCNTEKRQRLRQNFKVADTPDGLDFSGLDTALDGLGAYPKFHTRSPNRSGFTVDGPWPPRKYVNYKPDKYSPSLEGDLFEALTLRQRKDSYAAADFMITTNAQVNMARWRGYLVTSINLLAPLAMVVPELIPLLAIGGTAQFGLGLDQAINGKRVEDKDAGVSNIAFGLLNAAPLVSLPGTRLKMLFPGKSPRFTMPTRVNDQWGYPMSPNTPPRLPEEGAEPYFSPPPFTLPPVLLDEGPVAKQITRVIDQDTGILRLEAVLHERKVAVCYDSEHDAFILDAERQNTQPTYYYVKSQHSGLAVIEDGNRVVTDEMRMKTLHALGVDLQLPVEIPPINSAELRPLPKQILSLWVGDHTLPDELLKNIETNTDKLRGTQYRYRLYLSKFSLETYESNTARLAACSDKLEIETLEDAPLFHDFMQTEYYEHYAKAIERKHFSSACDILRYPLLNVEGGIYLDVDDTLLTAELDTKALISSHQLSTTPEGLVLGTPVSNNLMGMHADYNTNMMGSHANNDTLQIISDRIRERYLNNETFYDSRPLKGQPGHEAYVRELSRMTGPGVLNDVIDDVSIVELARLRTQRQLARLCLTPQYRLRFLLPDVFGFSDDAAQSDQALSSLVEIGNYHSWGNP